MDNEFDGLNLGGRDDERVDRSSSEREMILPYYMIKYNDPNTNDRISLRILCPSGTGPDDIDAVIEPGGNQVLVTYTWPVVDPFEFYEMYTDRNNAPMFSRDSVKVAAAAATIRKLHEDFPRHPEGKIQSTMRINLPFQVVERFSDIDGYGGMELLSVGDQTSGLQRIYLHLEMMGLVSSYTHQKQRIPVRGSWSNNNNSGTGNAQQNSSVQPSTAQQSQQQNPKQQQSQNPQQSQQQQHSHGQNNPNASSTSLQLAATVGRQDHPLVTTELTTTELTTTDNFGWQVSKASQLAVVTPKAVEIYEQHQIPTFTAASALAFTKENICPMPHLDLRASHKLMPYRANTKDDDVIMRLPDQLAGLKRMAIEMEMPALSGRA